METIDNCVEVERTDYDVDSDAIRHFEQALIDKEVVVFHAWTNEAHDQSVE